MFWEQIMTQQEPGVFRDGFTYKFRNQALLGMLGGSQLYEKAELMG